MKRRTPPPSPPGEFELLVLLAVQLTQVAAGVAAGRPRLVAVSS